MKNFVLCGIVCAAGVSIAVAQEGPWFAGVGDLPGGTGLLMCSPMTTGSGLMLPGGHSRGAGASVMTASRSAGGG